VEKTRTVKPKIVFYGGGTESAAAFAVLSAMREAKFEFSQIVSVGMSTVGGLAFLAGADVKTVVYMLQTVCICPYGAEKLIKESLANSPKGDCLLSQLEVPFYGVTVDLESGKTVIFGEKRVADTEKLTFVQDARLSEVAEASLSPWIKAFPAKGKYGLLCGIPSEAGVRYMFGGERGKTVKFVFAPQKKSSIELAAQGQQSRTAQLLAESLKGAAEHSAERHWGEIILDLNGNTEQCFEKAKEQVLKEKEHLLLSIM